MIEIFLFLFSHRRVTDADGFRQECAKQFLYGLGIPGFDCPAEILPPLSVTGYLILKPCADFVFINPEDFLIRNHQFMAPPIELFGICQISSGVEDTP